MVKLSAREGAGRPLARERDALRYVGDRLPADRFMPGVEERELAPLAHPGHGGGSYYDDLVALARDHRIPVVAGHGDFWSRNMLLPESRVVVPVNAADRDPGLTAPAGPYNRIRLGYSEIPVFRERLDRAADPRGQMPSCHLAVALGSVV